MSYFKNFPQINYNGVRSFNILSRAKVLEDLIRQFTIFYPYNIQQDERPDQIALKYYGSEEYTWLVFLSSQIYDPYYQFPLPEKELREYTRRKYNLKRDEILNYVIHYEYTGIVTEQDEDVDVIPEEVARVTWKMSPTTYNYLKEQDLTNVQGWSPVTAYDFELRANDTRRNIDLVSRQYLSQIEREIKRVFRNGV